MPLIATHTFICDSTWGCPKNRDGEPRQLPLGERATSPKAQFSYIGQRTNAIGAAVALGWYVVANSDFALCPGCAAERDRREVAKPITSAEQQRRGAMWMLLVNGANLREIAAAFGLSRERVRNIIDLYDRQLAFRSRIPTAAVMPAWEVRLRAVGALPPRRDSDSRLFSTWSHHRFSRCEIPPFDPESP